MRLFALMPLVLGALIVSLCAGEGFVDLLEGGKLHKWVTVPSSDPPWSVDKGELIAREWKNQLWTADSYKNFILDMEFNVGANSEGSLFFHANPEDPEQLGLEICLGEPLGKPIPAVRSGGALVDLQGPAYQAVNRPGEWNTLHLAVYGSGYVLCFINDKKVLDLNLTEWSASGVNPDGSKNRYRVAVKDLPHTGQIGLLVPQGIFKFRNMKAKKSD